LLDKDYLLNQLTEQNVINIMYRLGVQPHGSISRKEIWFQTICHCGDSYKLCYFKETKSFHCYTNCGSMSIFSLIMQVEHCSFAVALTIVAEELGINDRQGFSKRILPTNSHKEINEIQQYVSIRRKQPDELNQIKIIENTSVLNYFEENVFYKGWINDGISISTMHYFGIRWYELEKHIIIPHLNSDGKLIGIRRRSLQEKDKDNKYMPEILEGIIYTHSLNMNFYGLYQHKEAIKKYKKAIIVESEKSVMLAHEYYGNDALVIATCGFNISNWHRDILLNLGVEEIILGFDKDFDVLDFSNFNENDPEYKKFQRYLNRIYSLAYKFTSYCRTYVLWDKFNKLQIKDSPYDRGKETLEFLMENKIEITTNREE